MGKRLQMAPTGEFILWAVIPEGEKGTFNRAYGPFPSRSAAYSVKTALINNKRTAMKREGRSPAEIEAEVEAIEWSTTVLWDKVEEDSVPVLDQDFDPNSPVELAAEAMWNNQGPVVRGVRPKWDVARTEDEWARNVHRFRTDAALAVEAAAKAASKKDGAEKAQTPAEQAG